MNVSWISDTLALIELTADETENLGLSFSEEDYSSPKARRCLWEILTKAEELSGKAISVTANLTIDFMPDKKGGCLMIVSENEAKEVNQTLGRIYQTENFEHLIGFITALNREDYDKSALYRQNGTYRFYLKGTPDDALAEEFCLDILLGDILLESTIESYECLKAEGALEILSGFFLKK